MNEDKMQKKWRGTWPANCQMCTSSRPLRFETYFVDGRIAGARSWALMCPECFSRYGAGLGTGLGQKYDSKTLVKLEG